MKIFYIILIQKERDIEGKRITIAYSIENQEKQIIVDDEYSEEIIYMMRKLYIETNKILYDTKQYNNIISE